MYRGSANERLRGVQSLPIRSGTVGYMRQSAVNDGTQHGHGPGSDQADSLECVNLACSPEVVNPDENRLYRNILPHSVNDVHPGQGRWAYWAGA